jgi:hypothetical protein
VNQYVRLCIEPARLTGKTVCHDVRIDNGATIAIPVSSNVQARVVQTKPPPPKSKAEIASASSAYALKFSNGKTSGTSSSTVSLEHAFAFFPRSAFDSPETHAYAGAAGTVTVPAGAGPGCLVHVSGLRPGLTYGVFAHGPGVVKGELGSTAGPWPQLGTFVASAGGTGTFDCALRPQAGSTLVVNTEPQDLTILISAPLVVAPAGAHASTGAASQPSLAAGTRRPARAGGTASTAVSFAHAFAVFPGSAFDSALTHSYAGAAGTVTVPAGAGPGCLVRVSGLRPGLTYGVFVHGPGVVAGNLGSTAGPWPQLGTFVASAGGTGTFECRERPQAGSTLVVNTEPQDLTILISGPLVVTPAHGANSSSTPSATSQPSLAAGTRKGK